jgi:hypothetical protein
LDQLHKLALAEEGNLQLMLEWRGLTRSKEIYEESI